MESWRDVWTFTGTDGVVVVATMRYEQYTVWSRLRDPPVLCVGQHLPRSSHRRVRRRDRPGGGLCGDQEAGCWWVDSESAGLPRCKRPVKRVCPGRRLRLGTSEVTARWQRAGTQLKPAAASQTRRGVAGPGWFTWPAGGLATPSNTLMRQAVRLEHVSSTLRPPALTCTFGSACCPQNVFSQSGHRLNEPHNPHANPGLPSYAHW